MKFKVYYGNKKNDEKQMHKYGKMSLKMQEWLLLVFCIFFVLMLVLVIRIAYIGANDKYKKNALSQQSYVGSEIPYERGKILDRNGTVLATSKRVYHLILDARVLSRNTSYIASTISVLSRFFEIDYDSLYAKYEANTDRAYLVIRKNLTYDEKKAFEEYLTEYDLAKNVRGVWFEEEYIRVYPFSTLASHVVGFTSSYSEGTYGIEQYYNDLLVGTSGRIYGYYDAELNIVETEKKAEDGYSIVSTIDATVQSIVQKKVEDFLDTTGADNAGVIVMNPNTGEIYAMQSNYSYDLNSPRNLSRIYDEETIAAMTDAETVESYYSMWRNFCISDTYEPGSTFKPFTVAAGLEEGVITAASEFVCDGGEKFSEVSINCHKTSGHGALRLVETLTLSCNDALMQIAAKETKSIFHKYQEHFRFGELTGIDLPGESEGILMSEELLNETELATSSFGQSFNVTMIQMAAATSALINGGKYYEPHIVKEIRDSDGAVVKTIEPKLVETAVSDETSKFLKEAFYLTVDNGTASTAKIQGYLVGGKTGTAEKLPREDKKYVLSFVGEVPADSPEVLIYVVLDNVHNPLVSASASVATKLGTDILKEILPYMGIYPNGEIDYELYITDRTLLKDGSNEEETAGRTFNQN